MELMEVKMENLTYEKEQIRYFVQQNKKITLQTSEILTIQEVSHIFRLDKSKILDLINYGALKAVRSAKGLKISRKSVSDFSEILFNPDFPENVKDRRIINIFKPFSEV